MHVSDLAWIVLFLPLAAAVVITLFTQGHDRRSAGLSIGAVAVSFLASLVLFAEFKDAGQAAVPPVTWLSVGGLTVELGLQLDPLSLLMLLVVTGVGGAIHIYSCGYMRGERGFGRYFACLSLFTFAMLGIVLANNFVLLFICWELVGLSSYLLIGFWYDRPSAAEACKKAFLTNRLGDFGFLLGIILIWGLLGSVKFAEVQAALSRNPQALGALASLAGLLIFCGAMGKSAQFPLHVWLPDAMEGPTPVSALIHAATMVAAGVYMLCRIFFLFAVPPAWPDALAWLRGFSALEAIAWIGGVTALLSALIAVQQNDIKRILAYSTLSQLGYMVMAVGLGGPTPALFHLATHAFFKALLFLGAGSVIIALHHEQDIWKMGGLTRRMPTTFWTFLAGTLALCGLPPFSGFYSKDAILAQAAERNPALFALGVLVAALTTFYMFRLVFVAFLGPARSDAAGHAQESQPVMTVPLRLLALFSLIGGLIGIEQFVGRSFPAGQEAPTGTLVQAVVAPFARAPLAALGGLGAAAIGLVAAFGLYAKAAADPLPRKLGALARWMRDRFYFDELYAATVVRAQDTVALVADWWDRWIIAGLIVRGTHGTTELVGRTLRLVQTGNVQTYAFLFAAGVVFVLYFYFRR